MYLAFGGSRFRMNRKPADIREMYLIWQVPTIILKFGFYVTFYNYQQEQSTNCTASTHWQCAYCVHGPT